MAFFHSIMSWVMKKRIHQIELFQKYPEEVQEELFFELVDHAKNTEWGKRYDYKSIDNIRTFQERVPISRYDDLIPYIDRMIRGERNVLWASNVDWFAKSSGTTSTRSKFIPVSPESLEDCHYKAGKDMLSLYVNNFEHHNLFSGKTISIGGSHRAFENNSKINYGDVSAVIMENLPLWAEIIRMPSKKTAMLENWDEKLQKILEETLNEDITSLAGVPTWTLILLQQALRQTGKNNILEIWPNLELFVHGAVAFDPYRALFKELIPSDTFNYMETYTASEGFFGIQDQPHSGELLLMLDYGIFYEFLPMSELYKEKPQALTLNEVELDTVYALVITTNGGLWRYIIGDTVRFTSLSPYRIKIAGRTKHFINAFGEEVIMENANDALTYACEKCKVKVEDFTAGPIFLSDQRGGHEWIIEFQENPSDLNKFTYFLDKKLREINSDYDAKRYQDIALGLPKVHLAPKGTFYKWLASKGKLGGQYKVPRLSNNREYLDEILAYL